jgi:hypothetical protein
MPAAIRGKALTAAGSLALLVSAVDSSETSVETFNAVIASRDGERLRVAFEAEGQPALLYKPKDGTWDWRHTAKLVIPVENPGGEPTTLLLRVDDEANRSLSGKVSIAPETTADLVLWIDAPLPRGMGMIAGPSPAAAGLEQHTLPLTAVEGSVDASKIASVRLGIARPAAPGGWSLAGCAQSRRARPTGQLIRTSSTVSANSDRAAGPKRWTPLRCFAPKAPKRHRG